MGDAGVPVWRNERPREHRISGSEFYYCDNRDYLIGETEPGRWFPEPRAERLLAADGRVEELEMDASANRQTYEHREKLLTEARAALLAAEGDRDEAVQGCKDWNVAYVRVCAERDALESTLATLRGVVEELRQVFIDQTFVGITLDKGEYPTNEALIRNMACRAMLVAKDALSEEPGA